MKLNPDNPHVFTMTIEGTPDMINDEYWQKQYRVQRKERLTDAIHDYLDDKDTSIVEFYNDLRDVIVEMNNHHNFFAAKAEGALMLVHGKPKTENDDVEPPAEAWNG